MAGKKSTNRITKRHVLMLEGVSVWLGEQPDVTEEERETFQMIVERLEQYTKVGVVVRVRARNVGNQRNPRYKKLPPVRQRVIDPQVQALPRAVMANEHEVDRTVLHRTWTNDELDTVERMFAEERTDRQIAMAVGRSEFAVTQIRRRMGLSHKKGKAGHRVDLKYRSNTVLEAARRLRETRERDREWDAYDQQIVD